MRINIQTSYDQAFFLDSLRHLLITSRWQRWLFQSVRALLGNFDLAIEPWTNLISVLLAPLVMGAVLALVTLCLAKAEFRTQLRKR